MNYNHEIYAEAVVELAKKIDIENTIVAPIVFGGLPTTELLMYFYTQKHDGSVFQNSFYASSKTDGINEIKLDEIRFNNILLNASKNGSNIIYLDERTVSGKLGKGLMEKTRKWEEKHNVKINSKYAVLFDPACKADIRGLALELSNKERIIWTSEEEYKKFFYKKEEKWFYEIEPSKIRNLNHIHDIKMEIDSRLL